VRAVVNLGLVDADYALEDEAGLVQALGMEYVHLPVDFQGPRLEDYDAFAAEMDRLADRPLLLHCAANKRVGVFAALWRILALGRGRAEAESDLFDVWRPNPVWMDFYRQVLSTRGAGR
jgi:hypothetical protein